jgi:hypothetical protein
LYVQHKGALEQGDLIWEALAKKGGSVEEIKRRKKTSGIL